MSTRSASTKPQNRRSRRTKSVRWRGYVLDREVINHQANGKAVASFSKIPT